MLYVGLVYERRVCVHDDEVRVMCVVTIKVIFANLQLFRFTSVSYINLHFIVKYIVVFTI